MIFIEDWGFESKSIASANMNDDIVQFISSSSIIYDASNRTRVDVDDNAPRTTSYEGGTREFYKSEMKKRRVSCSTTNRFLLKLNIQHSMRAYL